MELTNEFRVALPVKRAWVVLTDLERIAPCMPGAQLQEIEGDEYRGIVKIKVGPITAQYKGQATFVDRDDANHVAVLRAEGRETRGQGNASATITATLTPDGDGTVVAVVTDLTVTGKVAQFGRGVLADVSAKLLGQFVDSLEQTVLADEPTPAAGEPAPPGTQPAKAKPAATKPAANAPATKKSAATKPAANAPATKKSAKKAVAKKPPAAPADPPAPAEPAVEAPSAAPAPPGAGPRRVDHPEARPVDLISTAGTPMAKRVGPVLAAVAVVWLLKRLLRRSRD